VRDTETVRPGIGLREVAHLLGQAEHRVTRDLSRLLARDGCSVEQWRALELLADGASHQMSELGQAALVPPPTLTRLIDRMVADNLAYRTADPRDRRRVLVRVTARGRRMHERLSQRMLGEPGEVLGEVGDDDLAQLAILLARVLAPPGR
jgi:DNA-binding MarR family transcriptional regulator